MKLHIVPARRAALWVQVGLRTFWRQPFALFGLFLLLSMLVRLASQVPSVGPVLAMALLPSVTLAMLAGTAQVALERSAGAKVILVALQAVRRNGAAMAVLGAVHALGFLAALGLSALADDGQFAAFNLQRVPLTQDLVQDADFRTAALITMVAYLPLSMMLWHAPALVHWHGQAPLKSLFFSLMACLRNIGALLLYGLIWSGITFGAIVFISAVAVMLASVGGGALGAYLMASATMAITAMFMVSVLFTFRDSFYPPGAQENLPPSTHAVAAPPDAP